MTYITFDIFKKMCLYGKIHDEYEYRELYKRKIVPTNLIPKDPSMYYKPKPERILKIRNMNKLFEKKYGRKYTGSDKDRKLRHKVYEELPDVKARRAKRSQEPEYKASQKISAKKYRSTPEYKARMRMREQLPKVKARRRVSRNKPETKAKENHVVQHLNTRRKQKHVVQHLNILHIKKHTDKDLNTNPNKTHIRINVGVKIINKIDPKRFLYLLIFRDEY